MKISIVLMLFMSFSAFAQDAVDVAQDLDIATVDAKANSAKSKAEQTDVKVVGVEARTTALEGSTLDHSGRLSTLELADPANQSQVNAIAMDVDAVASAVASTQARVATLEAAPPSTSKKYVVRDANGTKIDEWEDRSSVGVGAMPLASGKELKCLVNKEKVTFVAKAPVGIVYESPTCAAVINKVFVIVTNDRDASYQGRPQPVSFDNEVEGELIEGALYVPDWANPFRVPSMTLHRRVPSPQGDGSFVCNPITWDGGTLSSLIWEANLPTFTPPFALTEE
jgi:hypothetical protein